jgi:DNA gyrase subunit B
VAKTVTKKKGGYDADSIVWHRGLEGPRNDPSMYLGSASADAIIHMGKEVVGNSIDECAAGHGSTIRITIDKDNNVTVVDDGRGVPVEPHKLDKKRSTAEIVFSELHAGGKGKGSGDAYDASIGTHGLGAAVTNACSETFAVTIKRGGKVHKIAWAKGKLKKALKVTGKCPKTETGTSITFRHDPTVLSGKPNWQKLVDWINTVSYFTPSVTYYLDIAPLKLKTKIRRKHGLNDWLAEHKPKEADIEAISKPVMVQTKGMDLALQWFGTSDDNLRSYVSAVQTVKGGTHHKAVEKAICDVLEKFTNSKGALAKKYKPEDLRAGLVGCVNIRMKAPKFRSQTKEELESKEGYEIVYADAAKALKAYFDKNKSIAKLLIERANKFRGMEDSFKLSKKVEAAIAPKRGQNALPTKLAIATTKDRSKVELYVVEGDSAGGTAKQARDKNYQEVLPMKGKPPNLWKGKGIQHLEKNVEIINLLRSIGYDPKNKDNPLAKMRVGKIIILTDSDVDGQHITNLLLGVIWALMPRLFKEGKVWIVSDALFMAKSNTKTVFGKTKEQVVEMLGSKPRQLTRIKGWGEMDPPDMATFVFKPETRQHILVTQDEGSDLVAVMGDDRTMVKKLLGV